MTKEEIENNVLSLLETFEKNIIEYQKIYAKDYKKHRKFVKKFFNIDFPKKLDLYD